MPKTLVLAKYDDTASSAEILYPQDGIKNENTELRLEIEDRPYDENADGLAHSYAPIGNRWIGKRRFHFFKRRNH